MNRDDVLRLAETAGFGRMLISNELPPIWHGLDIEMLEHFAELVAAAEREACAKVCDLAWHSAGTTPLHCAEAIRARGSA